MALPRPSLALAALLVVTLVAGCTRPAPSQSVAAPGVTRDYHLFTTTLAFDQAKLGIPHDAFSSTALFANKGDTVVVHYHNLEDTAEHHTFTMDSPFNVNADLAANQTADITLHADAIGIYRYVCTLHQPTMTGYLVVVSG